MSLPSIFAYRLWSRTFNCFAKELLHISALIICPFLGTSHNSDAGMSSVRNHFRSRTRTAKSNEQLENECWLVKFWKPFVNWFSTSDGRGNFGAFLTCLRRKTQFPYRTRKIPNSAIVGSTHWLVSIPIHPTHNVSVCPSENTINVMVRCTQPHAKSKNL